MGYGFWNDSDDFGVPNSMTAAVFELAEKYGWMDPMKSGALGCVPERDAQLLANALERAMSDLPDQSTEFPEMTFPGDFGHPRSAEVQERILAGEILVTERSLRCAVGQVDWKKQLGELR